ncbi:MAG: dihydrofolate reductase [Pseudomonadota bacterium]
MTGASERPARIALIAAMDRHRLIGAHNAMPWRLPPDMARFRRVTMGKPVIMGRLTFESIGQPLPGRENLVVSRQEAYSADGCSVFQNLEAAFKATAHAPEAVVIGGAQLYAEALAYADRLYLTFIEHAFEGDTWFPEWDSLGWREIWREEHPAHPRADYPFRFVDFARVKTQAALQS